MLHCASRRNAAVLSLVYTWQWEGQGEAPRRVTVEIVECDDHTEVRLIHGGFATEEERDNHVVGWNDCLDRLEAQASHPG
jgi:uncharacterized protein YndB with AHSA1/START domain